MRAFVIAGGPSVTPADIKFVQRQAGLKIAVNSSIFAAPWADICFAMDHTFWEEYHRQVKELKCERWSSSANCAQFGVQIIRKNRMDAPIKEGVAGNNSGLQACRFAYIRGAHEIILLGVDCKHYKGKAHHHPDFSKPASSADMTERWGEHWASVLERMDARVINTSTICELDCFEYADLRAACEHTSD